MIDIALKFLADELKAYLSSQSANSVEVNLCQLVDESGKSAITSGAIGGIGISVINIEEERTFKSQLPEHTYKNDQHLILQPRLDINLHVIVAAKFTKYEVALKYISYILTCFQSRHFFTSAEYPALDRQIEKLSLELQSLSYEQLNQLWGMIGGKQLPSLVYKVRMITLQEQVASKIQKPIIEINTKIYEG